MPRQHHLARKIQRGRNQQFQPGHVTGRAMARLSGVAGFRRCRQQWERQMKPDPPFQPHPHEQHRKQHHVGGAAPDPLQVDGVTRARHGAGDRKIEQQQHDRRPRGCAPVPADARLDQQQHRKRHERAGEVGRRRFGIIDCADEHRDVDRVRRPGEAVVPPPALPRHRNQHERPREKARQQGHAKCVGAHRLDRVEPQRDQEHQRDQRAAGRFDLA